MTIHKDKLLKKYVEYLDSSGKFRIGKVTKIKNGSIVTGTGKYMKREKGLVVSLVYGKNKRERVFYNKVLCWIHHGHCKEEIVWTGTLEEFQERQQKKKPKRQRRQKQEKKKEVTEQKATQNHPKKTDENEDKTFPMNTMQTTLFAKGMVIGI